MCLYKLCVLLSHFHLVVPQDFRVNMSNIKFIMFTSHSALDIARFPLGIIAVTQIFPNFSSLTNKNLFLICVTAQGRHSQSAGRGWKRTQEVYSTMSFRDPDSKRLCHLQYVTSKIALLQHPVGEWSKGEDSKDTSKFSCHITSVSTPLVAPLRCKGECSHPSNKSTLWEGSIAPNFDN